MNIDLNQAELAQLVKLCETAGMSADAVTAGMHHKASQCLRNFRPTDMPSAEPGPDPRASATRWRGPI
jgi:hypothetical protein